MPTLGRSGVMCTTTNPASSQGRSAAAATLSIIFEARATPSYRSAGHRLGRETPRPDVSVRGVGSGSPLLRGVDRQPQHFVPSRSDALTASATEAVHRERRARRFDTRRSASTVLGSMGVSFAMYSTLSRLWPVFSRSTRPRCCNVRVASARGRAHGVGSYPVYDCVLYSEAESGPPGQYTQDRSRWWRCADTGGAWT